AKLPGLVRGRPITYPGQKFGNLALLTVCVSLSVVLVSGVQQEWLLWAIIGGAALFGVLFVLPIGGADMPVVISLLNAFTGLAVAVAGFELENNVLIVSGMLDGASGTLLTMMMGRAMNRSIANVLFGAFGQVTPQAAAAAAAPDGGAFRSARTDVAVIVGANDVVNPDARNNQGSPIYGMPILNVDDANAVVVLKRSMNPGFAGIENPLFYNPKTVMLFGDAKDSITKLIADVK